MSLYSPPRPHQSWGGIAKPLHSIAVPQYLDVVQQSLLTRPTDTALAVGLGRSYGDSVLNSEGCLIDMTHLDRVISFDSVNGVLRAEAGASIADILRLIVPKGWFLKTTPGTRFVTLGGAIANDVHGKNHHASGTIGCSLRSMQLLRSNQQLLTLTREQNDPLFAATIGGLGLTGIITTVELNLAPIKSAYLDVERVPFGHVREFFDLAAQSEVDYEHTVAWIDCASGRSHLGRGIFQRANWCEDGELPPHDDGGALTMPVDAPGFALNGLSVRLFNAIYYRAQKYGKSPQRMHYAPFFYPLDTIHRWNRLYGKSGFYQYQCVIPTSDAPLAIEEMLKQIARAGAGSFLAVLKTLGENKSPGLLSFPMQGATLALDFPNRGQKTLSVLGLLDDLVKNAGGRLYPAKDGRIPREMFEDGYPDLAEFKKFIDTSFSSDFWKRVAA